MEGGPVRCLFFMLFRADECMNVVGRRGWDDPESCGTSL
jgi:hypothetical protein